MENFKMTAFEELVADEMFPESNSICEFEDFPVKDRKRTSARRRTAYFKSKRRCNRLYDFWNDPSLVIQGAMRKTNIFRPTLFRNSEIYHFKNRSTVRKLDSANETLAEFAMEVQPSYELQEG